MASITLRDLTKSFGQSLAVDRLNLTVADGELIALLGPSGCGKTTTLRLIAGFTSPDAGEIWVDDRAISTPRQTVPPERRNMSMIFQSYAIWPHKTVFENVAFGLSLRRVSRSQLQSRVMQALEMTYLDRLADRYPNQLSGGQQQRVALARAIVIEPQILLLDEPLSNLDASLRDEMRSEIRRIHDQTGLTTLYITHDQQEALALCDRIVVMNQGTIQQVDTPEAVYDRPATKFVARFMGRCNVLHGTWVSSDRVEIGSMEVRVPEQSSWGRNGDSVALAVRPQGINIMAIAPSPSKSTPPAENLFTAQIEQQTYFGEYREYRVRLEHNHLLLTVVTPTRDRYSLGDRVNLYIAQENCRVLPSSSQDAGVTSPEDLPIPIV